MLRKQRVSVLNLYIERHNLTTGKRFTKKNKLDLVSAHIQLSAAMVFTCKDKSGSESSVSSSEATEESEACEDCVLLAVGSGTSDDDNIPPCKTGFQSCK